jgi:hypothetical protein
MNLKYPISPEVIDSETVDFIRWGKLAILVCKKLHKGQAAEKEEWTVTNLGLYGIVAVAIDLNKEHHDSKEWIFLRF